MNPVVEFFVNNFALLCISIGLIFISVHNYKAKRLDSVLTIWIVVCTLTLAVLVYVERYSREHGFVEAATIMAYFAYCIRPIVIFLFIRLANRKRHVKLIFIVPLMINILVYLPAIFLDVEPLRTLVYYFKVNADGTLSFERGTSIVLCFFSHFIAALYLGYLLYVSFKKLKGKHVGDAISIMICAFFAVTAVTVESIFSNKNVNLLNVTIAVSALFYNMYLFVEYIRADVLTGLFDRKTYFLDIEKMGSIITGVLMLDMNGLKYINDNMGHLKGDEALITIAQTIENNCKKSCYAYRLGGDEFAVLIVRENEEFVASFAQEIKDEMAKTPYRCSVGYAYRAKATDMEFDDLIKVAEKMMYEDKSNYYKESGIERRHG